MKKTEFIEKEKRNKSLYDFYVKHPEMTLEDIGNIYHISKARVSRIVIREKTRGKNNGN